MYGNTCPLEASSSDGVVHFKRGSRNPHHHKYEAQQLTGTGYKLAFDLRSAIFFVVALIFVRRIQHAFSLHRLSGIYLNTKSILLVVIFSLSRAFDRFSQFYLSILSSCTVAHYRPHKFASWLQINFPLGLDGFCSEVAIPTSFGLAAVLARLKY